MQKLKVEKLPEKFKKPIKTNDKKEILKRLAELDEIIESQKRTNEAIKEQDPFWFYEPSDGTISNEGMELMRDFLKEEDIPQGQLQCQKDVHASKANIILHAGGNQGGKTVAGAIKGFIKGTGEIPNALKGVCPEESLPKQRPQHVRVVGVDFPTLLKNLLPTYQKWVPREFLVDRSWDKSYNSEGRVLKLGKRGELYGTIEFMTNEQSVRSFQGPPRHMIIYDEEPKSDIYKENLMRFTTAERLDIFFGMTPTSGLSWVKDEILDRAETGSGDSIECFKVPSITNKRANLEILREVLSGLGSYNEIKMRLLGEFVSLSGLVYGNLFNRNVHVIDPFDIDSKKAWEDYYLVRGLDPHLVKPSACVEMIVDREENEYVVGCYLDDKDTEELKDDLAARVKGKRVGWSIMDKSADSTIRVFGDRNIYKEISQGDNRVPALMKSEKYTGSINAGVNEIKKLLKIDKRTNKPKLFFFDVPEVKPLIQAMQNLERETYANEDDKGKKDRIKEGKYDLHACLRYIHQRPVRWMPPVESVPEPVEERYI